MRRKRVTVDTILKGKVCKGCDMRRTNREFGTFKKCEICRGKGR